MRWFKQGNKLGCATPNCAHFIELMVLGTIRTAGCNLELDGGIAKLTKQNPLILTLRSTPSLVDAKELLADIGRHITGHKKHPVVPPNPLVLTARRWPIFSAETWKRSQK